MYFRVLFLRCRHGQGADLRPYYKLYRGLAEWVRQQDRDCSYRNLIGGGPMPPERRRLLDAIDFYNNDPVNIVQPLKKSNNQKWQDTFERLSDFHVKYNSSSVPFPWAKDPSWLFGFKDSELNTAVLS